MYSYNKFIVLRLQVSVGNLILELSARCVRIRGVETQMRARITRMIKKFLSGPPQFSVQFLLQYWYSVFYPDT